MKTRNTGRGVWMTMAGIVVTALVVSPCDLHAQAGPTSPVVAEVGSKKILIADVQDELTAQRRHDAAQNRLDSFMSSAPGNALQRLIDVKLLALEASARNIDQNSDVRRRIENLVDDALAAVLVADLTTTLARDQEALRRYYDSHKAQFAPAPKRRARHIVVKTKPEAEAVLRELGGGADFAALAKTRNTDLTRDASGEIGWVARGVMVPPFERALFALGPGAISDIVATPLGFHVIQLEEIEQVTSPEFATLTAATKRKVIDSEIEEFKQTLRTKYRVQVDEQALAQPGK